MKKTLAALALAGSITLIGSAPAMATTYPAPGPSAVVSDGTVVSGQQFIFSGSGMLANESVTVTVQLVGASQAPQTFSTTTNAQGAFSLPITINAAGTYAISAKGTASGRSVGPVTVKVNTASLANTGSGAALADSGSSLASTGVDSSLILWTLVGAGALAAGATSVVVVRRRAKNEVAA